MTTRRLLVILGVAALVAAALYWRSAPEPTEAAAATREVAVEITPVERAAIDDLREFSGSLEASARLTVAPKIAGQIERVAVDIGDTVARGDLLVTLDDDEYRQALAEADAQLEVARAELDRAESDAANARRTLSRVRSLNDKGIAPDAELDDAESQAANARSALSVARAGIAEARARVETARVRLGYTEIHADWPGADGERVVGERSVEPGDTVAANTSLLSVVSVTPLTAVIQVPEAIYTQLAVGRSARLRVAGAAEATHGAVIERIAPVFDPDTRRARVELSVDNDGGRLAPGMFVRIGLVAEHLEAAPVVPRAALVERGGETGVFLVDEAAGVARFHAVEVAFRNRERAAIRSPASLDGQVVTLGQAQLEDGIAVDFDAGDAGGADAAEPPATP